MAEGEMKLPTTEEMVEAAAKAAEAMEPVSRPVITFSAPPLGSVGGTLQVDEATAQDGQKFIRVLWASPAGCTVIDLPVEGPDGSAYAEQVGQAVVDAARHMRSGVSRPRLIVPGRPG